MGALSLLNFVATSGVTARGFFGINPITDLGDYYQGAVAQATTSTTDAAIAAAIQTAYGFSTPSAQAAATAGYDPNLTSTTAFSERYPSIEASEYGGSNIVLYASPADSSVSYTQNAEAFATKTSGTLVTTSGGHTDPSSYQGQNVTNAVAAWIYYGNCFYF
jgi:hypothetical protein